MKIHDLPAKSALCIMNSLKKLIPARSSKISLHPPINMYSKYLSNAIIKLTCVVAAAAYLDKGATRCFGVCLWQIFNAQIITHSHSHSGKRVHSFEISTILPRGAALTLPRGRFIYSAPRWIITFQRHPLFFISSHRQVAEMLFIVCYYLWVKFSRSASNVGDTQKGF